ncbi:RBBP9/YdeN family alpha/beta hydrolase [Pannonibacter indicus]|uniref:RBBP9/YdeN family alpha/beta hydrolase n=1 Tax=Pannonibacter indicus TaxID=466044 RepID=UPI00391A2723
MAILNTLPKLILPGTGGSGEAHWQSHWEAADTSFRRFRPSSWDTPELEDWKMALDAAISQAPARPVLVAHSLACLLVAHAAPMLGSRVRGAFLVAVPDPDGPAFPAREAASFANPPALPLPFPALIIASANDPYGTPDHAWRRAREWGAVLIEAGALGHINGASGLEDWPQGRMLLEAFCAGLPD